MTVQRLQEIRFDFPATTLRLSAGAGPAVRFVAGQPFACQVGALRLESVAPDPVASPVTAGTLPGTADAGGHGLPMADLVARLQGHILRVDHTGANLPTTDAEFAADITAFGAGRDPRFELVYDEYTPVPLLQFALVTDLDRAEVERRLPAPFGFGIPGLDEIFRSVVVASPWPGVALRVDLYYATDAVNDWESGEWLVTQGGRILPPVRR